MGPKHELEWRHSAALQKRALQSIFTCSTSAVRCPGIRSCSEVGSCVAILQPCLGVHGCLAMLPFALALAVPTAACCCVQSATVCLCRVAYIAAEMHGHMLLQKACCAWLAFVSVGVCLCVCVWVSVWSGIAILKQAQHLAA